MGTRPLSRWWGPVNRIKRLQFQAAFFGHCLWSPWCFLMFERSDFLAFACRVSLVPEISLVIPQVLLMDKILTQLWWIDLSPNTRYHFGNEAKSQQMNSSQKWIHPMQLVFWWKKSSTTGLGCNQPRPRVISGGGDGTGLGSKLAAFWCLDERWGLLPCVGGCIDSMDLHTEPRREKSYL